MVSRPIVLLVESKYHNIKPAVNLHIVSYLNLSFDSAATFFVVLTRVELFSSCKRNRVKADSRLADEL